MAARIALIVASVVVTLAVPAILAVNGIRLATNDRYVESLYDYGGVPDDRYGLPDAERERLALIGLRSIEPSTAAGIDLLREAHLPNGNSAFNARELAHMADVRTAVSRAYRFQIVAVIGIAILAVLLGLLSTTRAVVPVALARGAVLTLVVAVAVPIVAAASYDSFESTFHGLFFEGDSWRFEETDTLRRLYPDRFWLDTAVVIGLLTVLQAVVVFLSTRSWARRAGVRRPLSLRARTEGT